MNQNREKRGRFSTSTDSLQNLSSSSSSTKQCLTKSKSTRDDSRERLDAIDEELDPLFKRLLDH